MDEAFAAHYDLGIESGRLFSHGEPGLELSRTLELLDRFLRAPPADVLDVGGGPGVYASILANKGYRVELIDVLPSHVEQAQTVAAEQPEAPFAARLGDARDLDAAADSFDGVLLLGPLYHLTERDDRLRALREAHRVLRTHGVFVGAAVSRFASLLDGLRAGFLGDPAFAAIVERDLRDGQHRNPAPPNARSGSRRRSSITPMSSRPKGARPVSPVRRSSASKARAGCSQTGGRIRDSAKRSYAPRVPWRASPRCAPPAPISSS